MDKKLQKLKRRIFFQAIVFYLVISLFYCSPLFDDGNEKQDTIELLFAKNLSNSPGSSEGAAIAVDRTGNINVAWYEHEASNLDIYFTRSTDHGNSWSRPVLVLSGVYSITIFPRPAIAVDRDGNIYIAFSNSAGVSTYPDNDVYIIRSSDNGLSWTQPLNISNNPKPNFSLVIAVDGSNIYTGWLEAEDYKVHFGRSTDTGETWSLSSFNSGHLSLNEILSIAVDSYGNVNLVWDDAWDHVYFSRSVDNGESWSQPREIPNYLNSPRFNPQMIVDNQGDIMLVWSADFSNDNIYEVYFTISVDYGENWSFPITVTENLKNISIFEPVITINAEGTIHVVGCADILSKGIFLIRSYDNGATWGEGINLNNTFPKRYCLLAAIAADHTGNTFVVWSMYARSINSDIYILVISNSSDHI